jgi:hypothetical protein
LKVKKVRKQDERKITAEQNKWKQHRKKINVPEVKSWAK